VNGRLSIRAAIASAITALVLVPPAAAHGGGGALGFRSSVTSITPTAAGVNVRVLDYDDRLDLRNDTGKPLVVLGYDGEPYLAFRDGKVLRNRHSPATYLNDDRFGNVRLPAQADPKAPPEWEQVAQKEEYDWHDHRIHWMSRALPPGVAAAKGERHHVFDWKVPATLGGERLVIGGTLDYVPPPDSSPKLLIGACVLIALGGTAVVVLRRVRERRAGARGPADRTQSG
jgi:hypothetical protein